MKINIFRGDTKYYTFKIRKKSDQSLVNLDGGTLFFTAKNNTNDSDNDAVISKVFATSGTSVTIFFSHDDTNVNPKTYPADLQYVGAGGVPVITGKIELTIDKDVTQRITV